MKRVIGAGRAAGSRYFAPLCWLAALALLLVRTGTPPARAQAQHVHHWTAGAVPSGGIAVYHLDNRPVTQEAPAFSCETVRIDGLSAYDSDTCDAPGCPLPNQSAPNPSGLSYRPVKIAGGFGRFVLPDGGGH